MYFRNEEITPYRIHELYPRGGMNGAAFSVFLNGEFANKIRDIKFSDFKTDFMMQTAKGISETIDGLLSLWLHWFKCAEIVIDIKEKE